MSGLRMSTATWTRVDKTLKKPEYVAAGLAAGNYMVLIAVEDNANAMEEVGTFWVVTSQEDAEAVAEVIRLRKDGEDVPDRDSRKFEEIKKNALATTLKVSRQSLNKITTSWKELLEEDDNQGPEDEHGVIGTVVPRVSVLDDGGQIVDLINAKVTSIASESGLYILSKADNDEAETEQVQFEVDWTRLERALEIRHPEPSEDALSVEGMSQDFITMVKRLKRSKAMSGEDYVARKDIVDVCQDADVAESGRIPETEAPPSFEIHGF